MTGFSELPFLGLVASAFALVLVVLLLVRRRRQRRRQRPDGLRPVVIDGSNVMYWKTGEPALEPLLDVVQHLQARGYHPGVVFDANVGYLLDGRYQHHPALARKLGLPEDQVLVVPKGEPADPTLLTVATDLGACVVSNDRFRLWADRFPLVGQEGALIGGGYRDGRLWLDLPGEGPARAGRGQAGRKG